MLDQPIEPAAAARRGVATLEIVGSPAIPFVGQALPA